MKKMVIVFAGIMFFAVDAQAQPKPKPRAPHRHVTVPSPRTSGQVKAVPVHPITARPVRMPLPPSPPPPPLPPQP